MRKVTVQVWTAPGHYEARDGLFHQWGQELFEQSDGPSVSYTVGVVEMESGAVLTFPPGHIKFNEPPAEA